MSAELLTRTFAWNQWLIILVSCWLGVLTILLAAVTGWMTKVQKAERWLAGSMESWITTVIERTLPRRMETFGKLLARGSKPIAAFNGWVKIELFRAFSS